MKYSYRAKKMSGDETNGVMEAEDRYSLARNLKKDGYILVSYEEQGEKGPKSSFLSGIFKRVSVSEKMIFSRNLAVMIDAGLPATRALYILRRQTKNKYFKEVISSIETDIKKGNPVFESIKKFPRVFSNLFVAMVRMGEESGQLAESLKVMGSQLEKDYDLRRKIRGALIYPIIVMIALVIIGALLLIIVVPTLVETFEELKIELPMSTRMIIGASDFLVNHTLLALGIIIGFFASIVWFFKQPYGKRFFEIMILRVPIISTLVKNINAARTTRTLASLTASGVKILEALDIVRDVVQNSFYKKVIDESKQEIQKGRSISTAFINADKLYPVLVGEMMAVGEETGKLSEMLDRVADFYEEEVSNTTKNMSTVVEPVLMVIVGVVVGFFAVSMISPMYSIVDGI